MKDFLQVARDALQAVLDVGRGTSGRLILSSADEGRVRDALGQLSGAPQWQKIDAAPQDGTVILVNDSNAPSTLGVAAPWVAAKWLSGDEWSGWIYDDELLNDSCPLGPQPKYWLANMPPLPKD